jgi:MFS family permease
LLLLLAAFFLVEFAYPRFPVTDEIAFKSAGLNLSKGGAFAAPELEGFLHADPPLERVYAIYPPLYTWLFGQWARATGFGWAACVGYDALISAGLAFIIYGLTDTVAGALLGPLSMWRRTVLAFLAALLTLLFRNPGRPDELGMALGFVNAWWLFLPRASSPPQQPGVSFVSGVLAGLMLCTSPGVFLAFIPFLAALWLRRVEDMREIAPSLAAAGLGGGLAAVLCLTPLFLAHPYFYRQFFQHVQSAGFLDRPAWVSDAWYYPLQSVFILFATVPALCLGMVILWRTGRFQETPALFIAPLVGFALVFFLREYNYWWFLQPWFLLVAIMVAADFWWSRRSRLLATVAVGWLTIWLAIASAWPAKNYLVRFTLAPEQRLTPNARKLRELIPTGAGVLTANGWWTLGNDRSVYDPGCDIQDLARIDYFVTDSNGTGQPGVWARPDNPRYDAMVRESFEVISDTLPRTPLRLFGFRITNSAYGFGTVVLRRVPAQSR